MHMSAGPDTPGRFSQDEQLKARKLERLRERFVAATPATRKPVRDALPTDWRRACMAIFMVLVFVLAIVFGSGVI